MKRREFLATPAALAGLAMPATRPASPGEQDRRFFVAESHWAPTALIGGPKDKTDPVERLRAFDNAINAYQPPAHPLDVPKHLTAYHEYSHDDAWTLDEALEEVAGINGQTMREHGAAGCLRKEWYVVVEVGELVPDDSFVTISVNADGTGEYRPSVKYVARVYKPSAREVARYAAWNAAV